MQNEPLPTYEGLSDVIQMNSGGQVQGWMDGGGLYGEQEWQRFFHAMFESGVRVKEDQTLDFNYTFSGHTITIAGDSYGLVRSYFCYYPEEQTITVPSIAHYGRLVLRHNKPEKWVRLVYIQGVEGYPNIIRNDEMWDIAICRVRTDANSIIAIFDDRTNPDVCGAIRPKNLSEFNQWLIEINDIFRTWFAEVQGVVGRQIFIQSMEPTEFLEGAIWIKTDD